MIQFTPGNWYRCQGLLECLVGLAVRELLALPADAGASADELVGPHAVRVAADVLLLAMPPVVRRTLRTLVSRKTEFLKNVRRVK